MIAVLEIELMFMIERLRRCWDVLGHILFVWPQVCKILSEETFH